MAKFAKQHYETIAADIKYAIDGASSYMGDDYCNGRESGIRLVAKLLAASFSRDNPAFNQTQFLKACGIE